LAFVSAFLRLRHEYGLGLLFTAAMVLFATGLFLVARVLRMALHDLDHYD
jgi:hypothetical protein